MGNPIAVSKDLSKTAYDHLWMHFTRMSSYENAPVPTIVRGEGTYIYDDKGKRYLDGLSGLFVVNAYHGRHELAETAYKQAQELAFFPVWSYAHPKAVELAERLAQHAPGDLNKVFFTTGGGEAVETAWKLAKQYFKLTGKPTKYKVISRAVAYHGTPQGALSITGLPALKAPSSRWSPARTRCRTPTSTVLRSTATTPRPSAAGPPTRSSSRSSSRARTRSRPCSWSRCRTPHGLLPAAARVLPAGPRDLRPVRRAARLGRGHLCLRPPRHDVRLRQVRLRAGHDHLRQGHDLGLLPIGACIISDRLAEPFYKGDNTFLHGYTFGGHPVSAAVGLANLDIFEKEGLNQHVLDNEGAFLSTLQKLHDLPIVGDVRGNGFFYGIELVKDKTTKETFTDEETERVLYGFLSKALYDSRPVLPRRRPWRPGRAARSAADLHAGDLRRDRRHSAQRSRGGLDEALAPRVTAGCLRLSARGTLTHSAIRVRWGAPGPCASRHPGSESLACRVTDRPCLRSPDGGGEI